VSYVYTRNDWNVIVRQYTSLDGCKSKRFSAEYLIDRGVEVNSGSQVQGSGTFSILLIQNSEKKA